MSEKVVLKWDRPEDPHLEIKYELRLANRPGRSKTYELWAESKYFVLEKKKDIHREAAQEMLRLASRVKELQAVAEAVDNWDGSKYDYQTIIKPLLKKAGYGE